MSDYVELKVLVGKYAIAQLPAGAAVPSVPPNAELWSLTVEKDEISILCSEDQIPVGPDVSVERNWCCLRVEAAMEFELKGILAGILAPLAAAGVPVLTLSTYGTDYILVKESHRDRAIAALFAAGHVVN